MRKKSAAVPFGLSSSVLPLVGGDAVGGHDGFGWKLKGLVCGGEDNDDDDDAEGRGDVAEGGVEVVVPPPRKRRTPFICFCGLLAGIRRTQKEGVSCSLLLNGSEKGCKGIQGK